MSRADRFVRIYGWIGVACGLVFTLFGAWALWVAGSSVPLVLGLVTLAASIAMRRKHDRLRVGEEKEEEREEAGFPPSRE